MSAESGQLGSEQARRLGSRSFFSVALSSLLLALGRIALHLTPYDPNTNFSMALAISSGTSYIGKWLLAFNRCTVNQE